ncbi:hypothetical protein B484DRAFT_260991 [Ochromonadaceae sp. CCMP2298]|nr:hypothetical protein B484DRAFT_260991 [Ochromonadaceae sp. CCMP2298]
MQGSAPSPCWDEGQSTFVPLHLATPARRKRQALPLDHEDPALAHAAAMLSLLLAEEASELRARGKQTTGGVELRVLPTEHWAVFQAPSADVSKDRGKAVVRLHGAACVDAATEEAAARAVELSAHSPASTPSSSFSSSASPSTPSDGRALCLEGEVPPLSQLLVRLPFRTMLRGAGLGGGGEVTVVVAVTAQLMRGGCLIPLRLERECTVRVVSPLRLQLETFPCGDDSGGGGEVLVQALLLNDSPVSLQLVGYGVAAGGRGGGEGGLRVLDGPCQLPLLPDAELPVQTQAEAEVKAGADEGGCVALLPLEEYPLGVLLALPPSPSPSPSVVFYYRRGAEASNGKGVGMGIGMGELPRELLLQRCFRVSCALPLPTSAPSAPSVPAPAPHFELQVWASPSQTQAQSLPAALEAGRLSRHLYELTVTVGRGGGGGCTQWQWPCPITASTATSVSPPATLRSLGGLWVAAAACETGAWVAGGLSFRVLSALPLSLVGQEQEGQEKGLGQEQGVGRVRVRFLLEVELLPVFAGLLPLPPLRLQYALREQEQWQGGEDVFEEVLHPSRLRGADCVLVLPASTSASNSSSAPASSTRTHASRLCPAEASAE